MIQEIVEDYVRLKLEETQKNERKERLRFYQEVQRLFYILEAESVYLRAQSYTEFEEGRCGESQLNRTSKELRDKIRELIE